MHEYNKDARNYTEYAQNGAFTNGTPLTTIQKMVLGM